MQDSDEGSRQTQDNDRSSQPSSSYIYPVKSLLAGIQPAPPTQSRPSIPRQNSSQAGDIAALQDLLANQLAGTRKKSTAELDKVSPHSRSHSMYYPYPSRTATAGPSDVSEEHARKTSDPFSPRIQPIDGQSSLPISFTEAALSPASTQSSISRSSSPLALPELDLSAPSDPPSDASPAPPQSPRDGALASFKSKPLPDLTEQLMNEKGRASPARSVNSHVSHISQSGIVHLPPLSSASCSSRAGSRGSGSRTHSSSRKYFPSSNSNTSSWRVHKFVEAQGEEGKAGGSSSRSSPDVESNMGGESEAADDFITTRYRHETDDNGNHVVVGREGDVRRCEDEVRTS